MIVHTCGVVVVTREKGQHPSCFFWPLEASAVLAVFRKTGHPSGSG